MNVWLLMCTLIVSSDGSVVAEKPDRAVTEDTLLKIWAMVHLWMISLTC